MVICRKSVATGWSTRRRNATSVAFAEEQAKRVLRCRFEDLSLILIIFGLLILSFDWLEIVRPGFHWSRALRAAGSDSGWFEAHIDRGTKRLNKLHRDRTVQQ